jgi:hypothetical protein
LNKDSSSSHMHVGDLSWCLIWSLGRYVVLFLLLYLGILLYLYNTVLSIVCATKDRHCLPFVRTCVYPRFMMESVLQLILLAFCVVLCLILLCLFVFVVCLVCTMLPVSIKFCVTFIYPFNPSTAPFIKIVTLCPVTFSLFTIGFRH